MGHEAAQTIPDIVNEIRVVGRVSDVGEERELPSGDRVLMLRVVVARPPRSRRTSERPPGVDVFDVACWTARTRQAARRVAEGSSVEVTGSLRRRFFRAGAGPASRYEIEAATLRRLRVADRQP